MRRGRSEGGFTLIEIVFVVTVFIVAIVALAPFIRLMRERAHQVRCANNLRQISLALHQYAVAHDDAFPPQLADLAPAYLAGTPMLTCPVAQRGGTSERAEYTYTAGLTEDAPLHTIIVEDKPGNHGAGGKNVLRVGGAVEWVRTE